MALERRADPVAHLSLAGRRAAAHPLRQAPPGVVEHAAHQRRRPVVAGAAWRAEHAEYALDQRFRTQHGNGELLQ